MHHISKLQVITIMEAQDTIQQKPSAAQSPIKPSSKTQSAQSQQQAPEQDFEQDQENVPRDVRLLHLLLASQSIHQYEDQVPLQLMDFAHRYTASVLKDAIVYNSYAEISNASGSGATTSGTSAVGSGPGNNSSQLTVEDIRLAIAARTNYQFKPTAPKELLLQLAADRNKKSLPQVMGSWGVRLPPEKYCLTAKEWDLDTDKTDVTMQ